MSLTNKIRQYVLQRDARTCIHCGAQKRLTVDHIVPSSRGGSDDINNLVTMCRSCNSTKNDKWPEDRLFLIEEVERRNNERNNTKDNTDLS